MVSFVSNLINFNHLNFMYNFMSYIDNNLVRSKTALQENLREPQKSRPSAGPVQTSDTEKMPS